MRKLTITTLVVTTSIALTTGQASAHPGHTSCQDFGQHNASEAHDQIIDDEIRFFGPGNVDDVIALVHLGGTFDGEPVPALCEPL
jgi:hypothetical protein